MVSREASVHSTYYVPETLSSVQQPSLQHRLNRWCVGARRRCNDVSKGNGYLRIKCHRKNRRLSIGSTRAGNELSRAELGSARFGSASERAELGSARYFCEPKNLARLGSFEARELLRAEPSYEPRAIFPALLFTSLPYSIIRKN